MHTVSMLCCLAHKHLQMLCPFGVSVLSLWHKVTLGCWRFSSLSSVLSHITGHIVLVVCSMYHFSSFYFQWAFPPYVGTFTWVQVSVGVRGVGPLWSQGYSACEPPDSGTRNWTWVLSRRSIHFQLLSCLSSSSVSFFSLDLKLVSRIHNMSGLCFCF